MLLGVRLIVFYLGMTWYFVVFFSLFYYIIAVSVVYGLLCIRKKSVTAFGLSTESSFVDGVDIGFILHYLHDRADFGWGVLCELG